MYFPFPSLSPAVPCLPFPWHLPNPEGPWPVLIIHNDEHAILQCFSSFFLPNKVYSTFTFIILLICVKMRPRMPQRAMLSMYKEGYYLWDQQCTQNSHDNWFLYYLNNIWAWGEHMSNHWHTHLGSECNVLCFSEPLWIARDQLKALLESIQRLIYLMEQPEWWGEVYGREYCLTFSQCTPYPGIVPSSYKIKRGSS